MPDGFDPHTSLERISTLRDVMIGCRALAPTILDQAKTLLNTPIDDPFLPPGERMKLWEMLLNRGYGKPKQTVDITIEGIGPDEKRVRVFMPDNGRDSMHPATIDGEATNNA